MLHSIQYTRTNIIWNLFSRLRTFVSRRFNSLVNASWSLPFWFFLVKCPRNEACILVAALVSSVNKNKLRLKNAFNVPPSATITAIYWHFSPTRLRLIGNIYLENEFLFKTLEISNKPTRPLLRVPLLLYTPASLFIDKKFNALFRIRAQKLLNIVSTVFNYNCETFEKE